MSFRHICTWARAARTLTTNALGRHGVAPHPLLRFHSTKIECDCSLRLIFGKTRENVGVRAGNVAAHTVGAEAEMSIFKVFTGAFAALGMSTFVMPASAAADDYVPSAASAEDVRAANRELIALRDQMQSKCIQHDGRLQYIGATNIQLVDCLLHRAPETQLLTISSAGGEVEFAIWAASILHGAEMNLHVLVLRRWEYRHCKSGRSSCCRPRGLSGLWPTHTEPGQPGPLQRGCQTRIRR